MFKEVDLRKERAYALFISILNRSPGIADYVTSLCLGKPPARFVLEDLLRVLTELQNVTDLMLVGWSAFDIGLDTRVFQRRFSNIKSLFLANIEIDEIDFLLLFHAMPSLEHLTLCTVKVLPAPEEYADQLPVARSNSMHELHDMIFVHVSSPPMRIVPILVKAPLQLRPRKLQLVLNPKAEESVEDAQDLLREAGPSLEHLAMTAMQCEPRVSAISFADNTELRVLQLKDIALGMLDETALVRRMPLDWIPSTLAQVLPLHTRLQKIQLLLRMVHWQDWTDTGEYQSRLDWSRMDAELARIADEHPDVEISICVRRPEELEVWYYKMEDLILDYLPRLTKNKCRLGIICFQNMSGNGYLGGGISGRTYDNWYYCPLPDSGFHDSDHVYSADLYEDDEGVALH
ncbi:hypothetical protein POSPLADRAFT_1146856 [Postia placenta MAD-698-R-SB12]|uniref:F-box domain-containing protein n=1 Tax=Postia placenta MAD-698-R-SB12 TaxID=670580 RepID=A0A1X6MWZ7_9APHY|nr:hypothetical protein POSPLADRAFT_1146856 [Postia placenta MAD-698-R-SB12]OSX60877.1 hypothetical protein POSPLADRAFT_1146856 [Postia placenta MAD-698-R-SB12]